MSLHGLWGWRLLNGRPVLPVAVWLQRMQARVCGLSLQPIGCTFSLVSDARTLQKLHCAFIWHYISVGLCLFAFYIVLGLALNSTPSLTILRMMNTSLYLKLFCYVACIFLVICVFKCLYIYAYSAYCILLVFMIRYCCWLQLTNVVGIFN